MIITMKKSATKADIEHVMKQLKDKGLQIHESIGENLNVFGVVGDTSQVDPKRIEAAFTSAERKKSLSLAVPALLKGKI